MLALRGLFEAWNLKKKGISMDPIGRINKPILLHKFSWMNYIQHTYEFFLPIHDQREELVILLFLIYLLSVNIWSKNQNKSPAKNYNQTQAKWNRRKNHADLGLGYTIYIFVSQYTPTWLLIIPNSNPTDTDFMQEDWGSLWTWTS